MLDLIEHTRRIALFSSTLALAAGLIGCGSEASEQERDARTVTELTPDLEPVVAGNNAFAWSLYQASASDGGNLFFSPFSISAAFGMTSTGAAGDTASEMKDVLRIGSDGYHGQLGALIHDLGGEHVGRGYHLFVANRLFGQVGLPFERDFLDLTSQAYAAPLAEVDYEAETETARATINRWVSDRTRSKIPELIAPDLLTPLTAMVLANAIYFKANWATRFDPELTKTAPFQLASGTDVNVSMMNGGGTFGYIAREDVSMLEMDYQDHELSMVVLLPKARDALPALEATLTAESVNALIAEARTIDMLVSLPRFELEHELPLKKLVQDLGMLRAFDPEQADFSNMLDPSIEPLHLSFAVHKAFVKVDEQGTEAAAATAVGGTRLVSAPPSFTANRPFLYLIRDRLTGSILFMGRMENPAQNAG